MNKKRKQKKFATWVTISYHGSHSIVGKKYFGWTNLWTNEILILIEEGLNFILDIKVDLRFWEIGHYMPYDQNRPYWACNYFIEMGLSQDLHMQNFILQNIIVLI